MLSDLHQEEVRLEVREDEQEQPLALPSLLGIQDC
jgi:hypothetical protein